MTLPQFEQQLLDASRRLSPTRQAEVLDFVEFLAAKEARQTPLRSLEAWREDLLSISQWSDDEPTVEVASWKIESY